MVFAISTHSRRTAIAVSAAAALLPLAVGCQPAVGGGKTKANAPASSPPTTSVPASPEPSMSSTTSEPLASLDPAANGHIYRNTNDPCGVLDYQQLTATFGPDAGDLSKPHAEDKNGNGFTMCNRRFGPLSDRIVIMQEVMTTKTPATAAQFADGMRRVRVKDSPLTEIPGPWQVGYGYTDAHTGLHIAVYDGNLYLEIGAVSTTNTSALVYPALAQSAQHTLNQLRTS